MATFTFMFLVNKDWFGEEKQFHEPWNYGARDACSFCGFAVFKNLKSSLSKDNMPVHALDSFIHDATKMA